MFYITTPEPAIGNCNENAFVLRVSGMPQSMTAAALVEVSASIPESFLLGWADYQACAWLIWTKLCEMNRRQC